MIIPFISAVARDVFNAVPTPLREAAVALGSTRWEILTRVTLPYTRSAMIGAIFLGLGRALGETMAVALVLSVSGGVTLNLIGSGNPSTVAANIALQFPESSGLRTNALVASGLVLFLMTFAVNLLARWLINRRNDFSGARS
jgi:phosphate transport system permease protein